MLTGLLLTTCAASSLIQFRTSGPGLVPPLGWFCQHQPLITKMSYRLAYKHFDGNIFSIKVPLPK